MKIGILGAMLEEVSSIEKLMEITNKKEIGSRTYIEGSISGIDVVLTFSRWGKVASASTTTTLINLFNVDIEKTITVFEGPFDSFFIPNSVATAGASKLKSFFDGLDNVRYWYDNDSTGKNSSIDKIKSKNKCFLWKRFFKNSAFNNKRVKDLNELVVYIYKNREFKHVLSHVKESFSKNKYDIYHV